MGMPHLMIIASSGLMFNEKSFAVSRQLYKQPAIMSIKMCLSKISRHSFESFETVFTSTKEPHGSLIYAHPKAFLSMYLNFKACLHYDSNDNYLCFLL